MPVYRSYLYVPGTEVRRIASALEGSADAVVIDLEDAVPHDKKVTACANAAAVLRERPSKPVFVRVNGPLTGSAESEIAALAGPGLAGIRLPKAESPALVRAAATRLRSQAANAGIVPIIESALGVERAFDLATAATAVTGLAMGEADLRADLGVRTDVGLAYARGRCVSAAKAAGLSGPVQSVYPDLSDLPGLRHSTRAGRNLGFVGRSAIHPRQVDVINETLRPGRDEVAEATELVRRFEQARTVGEATVVTPSGHFVDEAVVRSARTTLALAGFDTAVVAEEDFPGGR